MKIYGQFCPLAQATQLLCNPWTFIVIRELLAGSTRFSDLKKGAPLMSPSLLSTRLKQLSESGVIKVSGKKGQSIYTLTQAGLELRPVVELLGAWGHRWAPSSLASHDLDAGLLMWDMRRTIDPSVFPKHRVVVEFHYPDAPEGQRKWWLISENSEIDLCNDDLDFDVDVFIECSLTTMTQVWTCNTTFNEAVQNKQIKVLGDSILTEKMQSWIRSSVLSNLGTVEQLPTLDWKN